MSERDKFWRVIAIFRLKDSDSKSQIASNKYLSSDSNYWHEHAAFQLVGVCVTDWQ